MSFDRSAPRPAFSKHNPYWQPGPFTRVYTAQDWSYAWTWEITARVKSITLCYIVQHARKVQWKLFWFGKFLGWLRENRKRLLNQTPACA